MGVFDMGGQGAYVWPAYAAFLAIFIGLFLWAWAGNKRAKARLEELEKRNDR